MQEYRSEAQSAGSWESEQVVQSASPTLIAVVIPAYRVRAHILDVISGIGPQCTRIYVVDDCCPEETGKFVSEHCQDPRVSVVYHAVNQGVGGAMMTGYSTAMDDGCDIIVKVDGDGQMDPSLIPSFTAPIERGDADYTKGNRFYDLTHIQRMPFVRRIGNLGLSFMAKASTGYWDLFDPTNGYTAIHRSALAMVSGSSISKRYFFETDMLFRLNIVRAVVIDVPMHAQYGDEVSNLKVSQVFGEFLFKHVRNLCKRIVYNYFLRDLSVASLELLSGCIMLVIGLVIGVVFWMHASTLGAPASAGAVMLPTLLIVLGIQLLLAFLAYDVASVPRYPLHRRLRIDRPRYRA